MEPEIGSAAKYRPDAPVEKARAVRSEPSQIALRASLSKDSPPWTGAAPRRASRPLFHRGGWHQAAIHDRDALGEGAVLPGPAVVEQPETTTVILPGWTGTVDAQGNLVIERAQA
ncbi:hypothetical protein [Mangrovicoccus ximenensis]|uniref:hypothetical protein n=1 Tax=Mangrovicoccus ximenensis TaxID=1911570 RepID=UPI000D39138A|nr:hypothetical protein [Mangrovicoccus ximenensis]